ncbi:hypothetical protein KBC75_03070 [Candidatus Shapirobacteria bacterium]|nr:hypothetical protein [Candidatus Shapirobacteria bacterium]
MKQKTKTQANPIKKMTGIEFLEYLIKHAYRGKKAPRDLSTNDDYLYGIKRNGKYGL